MADGTFQNQKPIISQGPSWLSPTAMSLARSTHVKRRRQSRHAAPAAWQKTLPASDWLEFANREDPLQLSRLFSSRRVGLMVAWVALRRTWVGGTGWLHLIISDRVARLSAPRPLPRFYE